MQRSCENSADCPLTVPHCTNAQVLVLNSTRHVPHSNTQDSILFAYAQAMLTVGYFTVPTPPPITL